MDDFKGRVAVITGGASGIGLATAQSLARAGARLVLADIEQGVLDKAVAGLKADGADVIGVRTDVASKESVDALAERAFGHFGAVHVLFNNAGVAVFGPTQDMTHADWKWSIDVNLWGPIHGVEAFVPRMVKQNQGGHVLFTASFAGLVANRELGPYCVTKFGVVALAECLQKDLRDHGIGVSVLCPMRVATNIDHSYRNRPADLGGPTANRTYSDDELAALAGRTLDVADVGDLVVDSIRRNDLFIVTHKEAQGFVKRRFDRIDQAFAHAL
ncbi:SDR family NAD(P)-dependent oxidoreductase [Zavarzinia sp. CC-PAN008]|uniref:SDR family NAD(P)-dependent oxidoreductase n=1 Tax=Zavarzinia sp. CC-PAN008 TaxID=3243332 RepID=UPI003F74A638